MDVGTGAQDVCRRIGAELDASAPLSDVAVALDEIPDESLGELLADKISLVRNALSACLADDMDVLKRAQAALTEVGKVNAIFQ